MACQSTAIKDGETKVRVGMAFPNTPHYLKYVGLVAPSLQASRISVFLVSLTGAVKEYGEAIAPHA